MATKLKNHQARTLEEISALSGDELRAIIADTKRMIRSARPQDLRALEVELCYLQDAQQRR